MSLRISGHAHCYRCMRYSTPRSQATQRRDAKYAKRKHLRRTALEEIAAGVVEHDDETDERYARTAALEAQAADDGCDEPQCGCHARRAAARAALDADRSDGR